jgi:hypothetical protein
MIKETNFCAVIRSAKARKPGEGNKIALAEMAMQVCTMQKKEHQDVL